MVICEAERKETLCAVCMSQANWNEQAHYIRLDRCKWPETSSTVCEDSTGKLVNTTTCEASTGKYRAIFYNIN